MKTPLYATTPSLGVRLSVEPGAIHLHMSNEGGRGAPVRIVLLPVDTLESPALHPSIDLAATYGDAAKRSEFRKIHCRLPTEIAPYPTTLTFTAAEWRRLACDRCPVIVLMLFHEFDVQTLDDHEVDHSVELAALQWFFASNPKRSWLRRGLVYLDAADIPAAASGAAAIQQASVVFALASCQYPAGLADGTPQNSPDALAGPADASMLRLAHLIRDLRSGDRPSLLVLAGDQIYTDPTAGLFDPRVRARHRHRSKKPRIDDFEQDWVRVPYQNWLGGVGSQSVFGLLPTRMILDDHEMHDNWEPLPQPADSKAQRTNEQLRIEGMAAFARYQRHCSSTTTLTQAWQSFEHRGLRFFLADTRTERQARRASVDALYPRIMSEAQELALDEWLTVEPDRPAFIVSPAILLPRRRTSVRAKNVAPDAPGRYAGAIHSDAWDGYPSSLHSMLIAVWRSGRSNVVFLSGDEHLCCIATATVTDEAQSRAVHLHSIHSSGLYSPFPFANSALQDFLQTDCWRFQNPAHENEWFNCEVSIKQWTPGDGFALLSLRPQIPVALQNPAWEMSVEFNREIKPEPREVDSPAATSARPGRPTNETDARGVYHAALTRDRRAT